MEEAISYGLLRSAVEMGESVTEAGAISAVAAFFRQSMDACAWAEEETSPPFSTNTSASGAPPLLRFPLRSTDSHVPFATTGHGTSSGTGADTSALPAASSSRGGRHGGQADAAAQQQLELVVSRGPGPVFSEHETRVASQAALLLQQALTRIRDRAAFSEAQTALEDSFRSMEEASEAVAVLVEEREQRAQRGAQQMTDIEKKHAGAMSAAGEQLDRARREAERLRRQVVEAERSMAAIAGAAKGVCRTVSSAAAVAVAAGAARGADDRSERGLGSPDGDDDDKLVEVIAVIERAAQDALRCSFAQVVRRSPAEEAETDPSVTAAAPAKGEKGRLERHIPGEGGPAPTATSGRYAGDDKEEEKAAHPAAERGSSSDDDDDDDETGAVENLHVPIPYYGGSLANPLALSIHGVPIFDPPQLSGERDRTAASALAALLGTALLALREKNHIARLGRQVEAERRAHAEQQQAAAVSNAAAEVEAQERGERAVAGMRALVVAAQASQTQAAAAAATTRRAERHTDALRHLLSGLGEAGNDHAAVAGVVDRLASAAVPGCAGGTLLTPRRHKGPSVSFSPDPRAWVAATATAVSRARQGATCLERGGGGRVPKGFDRQWTGRVEEAAAEAAATGKTVCVMNDNAAAGFLWGGGGGGGGDGGSSSGSRVVVCFSPAVAVLPAAAAGSDSSCSTPCLIAWMLLLGGAGDEIGDNVVDDEECSESQWASVSLLTEPSVAADAEAVSVSAPASASPSPPPTSPTPTPPPTLPLPPRVSVAMQAVVRAVGLALAAIAAAAAASDAAASTHTHHKKKRTERSNEDGNSRRERKSRHREKEEMKQLRDGTAALTDRVQMLEGRAASLRASEARSAAALARAQADAGALRGELQLTALERDRLVRRLEETAEAGGAAAAAAAAAVAVGTARREAVRRGRERGGSREPLAPRSIDSLAETPRSNLSSRRWQEGSGGLTGALRPYNREQATTAVSINAQSCGLTGSSRRQYGVGGVVGTPPTCAAAEDRNWVLSPSDLARGVEESKRRDGGYVGGAKTARPRTAFERSAAFSVSSLPPPPPPLTAASSAALQHMASIHARLSDSLKRSTLSATTAAAPTTAAAAARA